MADGMTRFRNNIYVPDNSELKNIILREFHVKLYLGHLGYEMTLTTIKKLNHSPNLKK